MSTAIVLLFSLPNPTKADFADPSNCVYDNDIDMASDEDEPSLQGGSGEEGVGSLGATHVEEMLEPPMTRSCSATGSLGCNEAHFYQ